jgi:hypothetical protein
MYFSIRSLKSFYAKPFWIMMATYILHFHSIPIFKNILVTARNEGLAFSFNACLIFTYREND